MALLRVSYQEPSGRGHYYGFFVNFIDNVERKQNENIWDSVYETLQSEYGARIIKSQTGIMDVEFATEEDITSFLIRWA